MNEHCLKITFPEAKPAEAGQLADELRAAIANLARARGVSTSISFELERTRDDTQDFGATLIVLLGTPAVAVLAKGLHDFIAKIGNRVHIVTSNGTLLATGDAASNIDVAATVAALAKVPPPAAGG